jgi:threonine dehydratase
MLGTAPEIDTLIVPIGGGGLISGMAVAAKALKPDIRVVGVQAALYPSMYNAINNEHLPMRGDTLAEGIAVKAPGRITTEIVRRLVDEVVLVSEQEIERAVSLLINIEKTVVEGAGAVGLATLLANRTRFEGRKVGLVLCGGNIDPLMLADIIERGMVRTGRLTRLTVELRDLPGALARVTAILAEQNANIEEIFHQRAFTNLPVQTAEVDFVLETRDREHVQQVIHALGAGGFPAQLHND